MNAPKDSRQGDPLRYDGRVIIVTGAGRGMGREHALLLASRGARVVVNDLGTTTMGGGDVSDSPASNVVTEITTAGGEAIASFDTVATAEGATRVVGAALDAWGRVDGVLHNAGIARFAPIQETDEQAYREIVAVSMDGAFFLTRAVWPVMAAQNYGRLVHITSGGGLIGVPNNTPYAMAKTGLLGLMNVTRLEGADLNINVNLLGVAAHTRMTFGMFGDSEPGRQLDAWWARYLRPELVAPVAAWLLHEANTTTGAIYNAAGGHVSRTFLAETPGYTNLQLTIEDVRDNETQIQSHDGYRELRSSLEYNENLSRDLTNAGAEPLGDVLPVNPADVTTAEPQSHS